MVEIQGPDDDDRPGRSLAPPHSPEDQSRLDLDGKLTSLAYALEAIRRQADATTERTARIEGVVSALLGTLESLRGDQHDLTARTEQRVLRGLEFLDSRLAQSTDSGRLAEDLVTVLSDTIGNAVDTLRSQLTTSTARLEERLVETGAGPTVEAALRAQGDEAARSISHLSDKLLLALENLKSESVASTARLELKVSEESKGNQSVRGLVDKHSKELAESVDSLRADQTGLLEEIRGRLTELERSVAAARASAEEANERSTETRTQLAAGLQRLEDRVSGHVETILAQMHERIATLLDGLATEESVRKIDAALAAAAESGDTTSRSAADFQRNQTQALRNLEDKLHGVEQTVVEHLEGAGRSAAQSAERSDKTLDQLITALERMDGRFSHQVSSSEYALHGALADLERKITELVSEAVQGIEARVRQREEALVRLIVAGGLEGPDFQ